MKRFLAKIAGLLVVVLAIVVGINSAYLALYRYPGDGTGKFSDMPASIQVANLGSSHGEYGFNYEDLEAEGLHCFNFALGSQSLEYDWRILEEFGNRLAPGATVFVCVSDWALYGKSEVEEATFSAKNKRYYRILPNDLVREYDSSVDFWLTVAPSLDAGMANLIQVFSGRFASEDATFMSAWSTTADDIDLAKDVDAAYKRHLVTDKQYEDGSMILNEEGVDALYKIIMTARGRGAEPVLVITPMLREYTDAVEKNIPGFYDDYYVRINEVVSATGVRLYDYSRDTRFCDHHELFRDGDHLNKQGARLFTDLLYEEAVTTKQGI